MLGAIVGDVVGSTREFHPLRTKAFDLLTPDSHFTDDTVLTIAVAMAAADGRDLAETLRDYSRRHVVSYGLAYWSWVCTPSMPAYGSWSNGAAMRVSPAAWLASHPADVLRLARWSAEATHDHPEAVRAAASEAVGADRVVDVPYDTWAEDFAYIAERVPASMFWLGVTSVGKQKPVWHSPTFVIDEDAIPIGAAVFAATVLRLLQSSRSPETIIRR